MGMLLTIALRNLWRHKRRSVITSLAIVVGLALLMFSSGGTDGITNSMIGGAPESASEPLVVQVGIDDTDDDRIDIGVSLDATRVGLGLTGLDFSSPTGAGAALDAVDAAIDTVNGHRATIGANQNRLASVLRNHENMLENEVEAQSVVEDFDYAEGIAELTRANVLADAGHALLARSLRQQRSLAAAMTSRLIGAPK